MTKNQADRRFQLAADRRARELQGTAYALRQHAISIGGDLEGWRLARRIRDVESLSQILALEQELDGYLRTHRTALPRVA